MPTHMSQEVNSAIPQCLLFGSTLSVLYINDLPKSILQSFVNIYADDTTVYTSKILDDQSLTLTFLCRGKNWLVTFNASKLVTFHHH